MLKRQVTPLTQIDRRVPEAGRLRMGVKSGRAMKAIDTWRFTSPNEQIIKDIAAHYGGSPVPWNEPTANPSNQWQVISEANEIRVLLMPDGISTWYELWTAGGCKRRCDGVKCAVPELVGDADYEMVDVECICDARGEIECDPHTRMTVVLPEFSFAGAWRFETKGWNAAQELPGMFDLINAVHARRGMVDATLSIESRERMTPTGKRKFKVPKLSIKDTVLEIAAGSAQLAVGVGTPAQSTRPALAAGVPAPHDGDDEATDAELILPGQLEAEQALAADAANFGLNPDRYVAAVKAGSRSEDGDLLVEKLQSCSRKVRAGELVPLGFKPNGRVQWE